MDRDSSALEPVSISLATNDFFCCTTTNGLCPPLLSYLPPLSFFPSLSHSVSLSLLSISYFSYYSIPCYLSTSPLHLYLIFISLCLCLPLSFSVLSCFFSLYFHLFPAAPRPPSKVHTLFSLFYLFLHSTEKGEE